MPEPAARKQDVSKFGQTCSEQSRPAGWVAGRLAVPGASDSFAFTSGTNMGKAIADTPRSAKIASGARDLIIGVF